MMVGKSRRADLLGKCRSGQAVKALVVAFRTERAAKRTALIAMVVVAVSTLLSMYPLADKLFGMSASIRPVAITAIIT
jgi:hypothetical protein